MTLRYTLGVLLTFICLSLSASEQTETRFDDSNHYAYKNYTCLIAGVKQTGYGRPSKEDATIHFQMKPGERARKIPKNQCHRINVMRIQNKP